MSETSEGRYDSIGGCTAREIGRTPHVTRTVCGSIHPVEVEWHCECRKDPEHEGNHRCYGCGFEWEQGDIHSRMPSEDETAAADLAVAESMYRPNGQWRNA